MKLNELMTFELADALYIDVIEFLKTCGEVYNPPRRSSEINIICAISCGSFFYIPGELFMCWKCIDEEDEKIIHEVDYTKLRPGKTYCVLECGSKKLWPLHRIENEIFQNKVDKIVWNRHQKGFKVYRRKKQ